MESEKGRDGQGRPTFRLRPVGTIRQREGSRVLQVFPEFRRGLLGIEGFSHIWVLYWFHENDEPGPRAILEVHPRRDPRNPLTGVFGSRSHMRPNLIGMDLCEVMEVRKDAGEIVVKGCDARDRTPLLDIKPYLPYSDSAREVRLPRWAGRPRQKGLLP